MHRTFACSAFLLAAISHAAASTTHPYDLIDVRWHVVLDAQNASVAGDIVNTVKPDANADEIWFDRGELNISYVGVDGAKAHYRIVGEKVYVSIPAGKRGKSTAVRIKYGGKPRSGLYFIPANRAFPATTPVIYSQGEMVDNRYWLVTYDRPDDKATSEGIIDVPKGYTTYSNGKLLSKQDQGNRSVWHWKMDKPHATYLISVVAGPYETGKESWDGIPVQFGVPKGLMEMGQTSFGGTGDMIRLYSTITGFRYPYPKFSQEAVPDYMFGGMENITAVTQTIGALHPKSADSTNSSEGLVLHELAHQWFGDTVTCSDWSDAWINEGWASFMPSFYVRDHHGQEAYDLSRYDTLQGALGSANGDPSRPVVWTKYVDPLDMFGGQIYAGGAARMFMLMDTLGEKNFWQACTKYLNERKYTSFDTHAFFDTWSRASGKNLDTFMNQWFFRGGAPSLTVKWQDDRLVVSQTKPYYDLDLPVWVLDGDKWVKNRVHLTGASAGAGFQGLSGKPVLIDPEVWTMANFTYSDPLTLGGMLGMYRWAPNAASRARIMDTWLRTLSPVDTLAFAKSLQSKAMLQRYIGSIRDTEGAQDFVISLTKDADRRVAANAYVELANLPYNEKTQAAFEDAFAHDPNVLIRQGAVRELLNETADGSLAARLWTMPSFNDGYRQIALAWWSAKHQDDARQRCMAVLANPPSEAVRVQAIGILGRLKDLPNEHKVLDALKSIVQNETSFGARSTAINALADYGNSSAISVLLPLTNSPQVFLRNGAKGAIARLNH
jgi:aminopeptidase N